MLLRRQPHDEAEGNDHQRNSAAKREDLGLPVPIDHFTKEAHPKQHDRDIDQVAFEIREVSTSSQRGTGSEGSMKSW